MASRPIDIPLRSSQTNLAIGCCIRSIWKTNCPSRCRRSGAVCWAHGFPTSISIDDDHNGCDELVVLEASVHIERHRQSMVVASFFVVIIDISSKYQRALNASNEETSTNERRSNCISLRSRSVVSSVSCPRCLLTFESVVVVICRR